MKVIFALGNPKQRYDGTRHNVGFWLLDQLATQSSTAFKPQVKFSALIAEYSEAGEKILLVKPTTYYNEVGISARAIMDFYKLIPSDFLIIHDDLALPLGTVRTRLGGSDGGNNGLKSLAAHIGVDTSRLRIGTWTELHHGADKVSTVLGKFTREELAELEAQSQLLATIVQQFVTNAFVVTTH